MKQDFIIPAKFYSGEYFEMFHNDKEKWNEEVQKHIETWEKS